MLFTSVMRDQFRGSWYPLSGKTGVGSFKEIPIARICHTNQEIPGGHFVRVLADFDPFRALPNWVSRWTDKTN